jgi:hypothetical protein
MGELTSSSRQCRALAGQQRLLLTTAVELGRVEADDPGDAAIAARFSSCASISP